MTLRQLEIFVLAANQLNLGVAAKELRIAQPSVSEQLRLLEEELGTQLHRKIGRGIELTEAGRLFLKEARAILTRIERIKAKLGHAGTAAKATESLTVGASYSPSTSLLPSLLARLRKTHPQVQLDLRTDNRLAIEGMILRGEVELAVINNPPLNRNLTMELLRSEPLVAFVSPHHPLAKRKHLDWEDLTRVGFIIRKVLRGRATIQDYIQHLRKNGLRPNVILRCDTPAVVKEAVRKKLGVGILYQDVVAGNVARREFKTIKMPGDVFAGKSFIIYHKNRPLLPLAQEFLTLLHQHTQKS